MITLNIAARQTCSTQIKLLCLFLLSCFSFACQEKILGPIGGAGIAPAAVSNVIVEPGPGSVKLTYSLPASKNLLYVKALVNMNGTEREVKASSYQNFLEIKGFGDSNEYSVSIFAVSRDELTSEPVKIQVVPLKPPVTEAFESLELFEDFGGATVRFENPSEGDLSFFLLTEDDGGDWESAEAHYSKRPAGFFTARGYDTVARKFGVYVQDRWGNRTDTLIKNLVPIFERQLDRTKFSTFQLPTDSEMGYPGWPLTNAWNGTPAEPGYYSSSIGLPQHVTINLGVNAKISRVKLWQRTLSNAHFSGQNIRKFEIWGSDSPAADGSFNGWIKMLDGESIKPSGLPIGQISAEDTALAMAGEDFSFPAGLPEVQYLRLRVTETWSPGNNFFLLMEMAFFGGY